MGHRNGNNGSNFLVGGCRDDEINGRGGNDVLFGWFGNDILRGGNGNDWLFGGYGSDRLFGGNGNDVGFGGSGNDLLVGGRGSDAMFGGSGNDTFVYRAERNVGETDYYAGGSGNDRLILRLNADEAADADVQADIAAFEDFIAAGGGGNFTFDSLGLTVNSIERLTVRAPDPVEPTNTAPTVSGAVTLDATDENTSLTVTANELLAGATDADGDQLSVSNVTVTSGNASITQVGTGYTITPDADDESEVTLSYTISDGQGGSVTQTASFDLLPVNNDPTLNGAVDLGTTPEDSTITVSEQDLLAGASDADNDTLTVAGITVLSGDAVVSGNATDGFTITPAPNYAGNLVLGYTIEDGQGGSVEQTASLFVDFVQDEPEAPDVTLTVSEDGTLTFLASDFGSDADGDALSFDVAESNTTGQLQINGQSATYTPGSALQGLALGETFADTFIYTVSDGQDTTTGTVTVTVTGVNDDPTVGAPVVLSAIDENTSLTVDASVLIGDATDVDGDSLSVSNVTVTSGNAGIAQVGDSFTITPDADDESEVTLSYLISDGQGGSVAQTASFDLLPVATNTPPIVTGPVDLGPFDEDTSLFVTEQELLANALDADGDGFNISAAGVTVTAGDATVVQENGGYRITPDADFNTDPGFRNLTLAYTVEDGNGGSVDTTANVSVTGVQDAPTVQNVTLTVNEDDSISFRPGDFAIDVDGDALSLSVDPSQAAGQVELVIVNGRAEIVYTSGPDLQGLDETITDFFDFFEFSFSDGIDTTTAGVSVFVQGQNDAPVADDIQLTTAESQSITFDLDDYASDVDDSTLTFALTPSDNTLGEIELDAATGEVTYTPGAGFEGLEDGDEATDTFVFTASDGQEVTQATVTVTVEGESEGTSNAAPVAVDDPEGIGGLPSFSQPVTFAGAFFDVLENDSDPDGDALEIIGISLPDPNDEVLLFGAGDEPEILVDGLSIRRVNTEFGQELLISALDDTPREVVLEYTISDGQAEASALVSFDVVDDMVF